MSEQIALFIDFENVALWAEQEFIDFELTSLMDYLSSRGSVVIKRAYGDWGRFSRYREEMLNNSIDLIQLYSIRLGKNRADIRMALDALEIAITRDQIDTFVIVSGDSDFGPLVSKLREYSRYTLGIGPRDITHPLLVRACNEFVYFENVLNELNNIDGIVEHSVAESETARTLLSKALQIHTKRGEQPVLATTLKQTMLMMDSAFNETNLGFSQFQSWLETNRDLLDLFVKDSQIYAALKNIPVAIDQEMRPWQGISHANQQNGAQLIPTNLPVKVPDVPQPPLPIRTQYQQIFNRLKMTAVDLKTRRDVLRDIYRELLDHPGERTTDDLLEVLCNRYEAQGLIRSKTTLRQIWQMGFRQRAFDYKGEVASVHVPVWLAPEIDSEAAFVHRAESGFVYAVINAGLEIDKAELASILLHDRDQTEYIQSLITELEERELVTPCGDNRYRLPGQSTIPFFDDPVLVPICNDIVEAQPPENLQRTVEKARYLSRTAMLQRSQDFAASARTYLFACRIQWDIVEAAEIGASLEDLRWYMASYASVKAGELSQIHRDYASSRPYYMAFFKLVQEDDPLWARMRGLINPMLSYYWVNAWRELGLNIGPQGQGNTSPAEIAVHAATFENQELSRLWFDMTQNLAEVNPGLIRRVANQIRMNLDDSPHHSQVAERLEQMLMV